MDWKWKAIRKGFINPNRYTILKIYTNGATILSELLVRKALNKAWKLIKKSAPPQDTASYKIPWKDAIIWTALYSMAAGMAGLVGRRLARTGWDRAMS